MNVIYVLRVDEMEFRTRVEFLTMINVVCASLVCLVCRTDHQYTPVSVGYLHYPYV